MRNEIRHNLTITGTGSTSGGVFRDVKVVGEAVVDGDLDCMAFKCTGTARMTGNMKSTSCAIVGTVDLKGNLEAGEARVTGTLDIDGNVKAQSVKSNGETRIQGGLAGEDVKLDGLFMIKGNCEAENLQVKGVFTVGGLMNAGSLELHVHSKCEVHEIGGEKIEVRRGTGSFLKRMIGLFYLPSDFYEGTFRAETIEGDDIYVEYTTADVIRGSRVTIGPGCRIGHVEYTERLEQSGDSVINGRTQV